MERNQKLDCMWQRIRRDTVYQQMLRDFVNQEKEFDRVVGQLPVQIQDVIWDYVSASNTLDAHCLEIVCEYAVFPDGSTIQE